MTRRSRARSPERGRLLTRAKGREIAAIALLAAALFLLLALVPMSVFGDRAALWFPSGNMMDKLGGLAATILKDFAGAAAVAVPLLLAVAGARTGAWLSAGRALSLAVLLGGLLLLVPVTTWVATSSSAAGSLGASVGGPLKDLVGPLGAGLVCGVGLVALSVATLGWNPLSTVGRGVVAGGGAAGRTAKTLAEKGKELADKGRELAEARARAAAERNAAAGRDAAAGSVPVAAPLAGFEPEWLGVGVGGLGDPSQAPRGGEGESGADEDAGAPVWPGLETVGEPDPAAGVGVEPVAEGAGLGRAGEAAAAVADMRAARAPVELADPNPATGIGHEMPPVDLLSAPHQPDRANMERQLDELGRILVEKLKTFNIECELGGRTTGPMVTQFEVVPAPGIKVNRIANLDADLALAMRAKTVRIVAPIPGKGAVGVEIPNPQPEIVNLRELLEAPAFRRPKGELPLALGKDLNGRPYVSALEKMPHLLIAGATGSGKSVCLNTIVTSLVYRHTPETLRLLMIDPKMVELSVYARLPHLRHNVVTDPRDAAGVLKWAVIEMERRYSLFKANHVRSIQEFNLKVRGGVLVHRAEPKGPEGGENRWIYDDGVMPYIVVVVDELADLMMTVQSEVEKPLTQLAQKARAIGIHLIVATQRPSVNVITGLIKANFPTRIAFRVASKTDSRTILDQNGADALLGNGDMLFLPPGGNDPVRIQGAYLSTEDTESLMGWYVELLEGHAVEMDRSPGLETDILEELRGQELEEAAAAVEEIAGDWDELFRAAAEICIQHGGGSTSLLQRRLSIGYGRAARIVDQLFDAGVLGPSEGAKGREVLVSMDGLDAICGAQ